MNPLARTLTRQPQQPFRSTPVGGTCTRIPFKAGTRVVVEVGAMPRAIAHYRSTLLDEICGKSRALDPAIQSLSPRNLAGTRSRVIQLVSESGWIVIPSAIFTVGSQSV